MVNSEARGASGTIFVLNGQVSKPDPLSLSHPARPSPAAPVASHWSQCHAEQFLDGEKLVDGMLRRVRTAALQAGRDPDEQPGSTAMEDHFKRLNPSGCDLILTIPKNGR